MGDDVAYFVKVIPPSGRARIHAGDCKFCRDGQGMENQDKGTGPTYWHPAYPLPGFQTSAGAGAYMTALGPRYHDVGPCAYCMQEES
jgi:hypothetical protein